MKCAFFAQSYEMCTTIWWKLYHMMKCAFSTWFYDEMCISHRIQWWIVHFSQNSMIKCAFFIQFYNNICIFHTILRQIVHFSHNHMTICTFSHNPMTICAFFAQSYDNLCTFHMILWWDSHFFIRDLLLLDCLMKFKTFLLFVL